MSQPDSKSTDKPVGVLVRKPKASVYVAMLGVAVAALTIACLMLLGEMFQYGFQISPN